jgi:7-cyano-7-deazaguanine synthase
MSASAALVSGGLDSGALLALLANRGPVHPVYIRAGLPWEEQELEALTAFTDALLERGIPLEPVVELSVGGDALYGDHWSMTGQVPEYDEPDEAVYLPGRNVILIGLAAVWCSNRGVNSIAIGTLDCNPFSDGNPEFFENYGRLLSGALNHPLVVEAPFRGMGKAELVRRYADLPLGLTLTCMAPIAGVHCGACNKCRERREAFYDAGVTDSATYAPNRDTGRGQEVA